MSARLAILAAGLLLAGVAQAQSLADLVAAGSPADLARAVDGICLKPANPEAQAAPWGLTRSGRSAAGDVYTKRPLQVTIATPREIASCIVTSNMDEATTLAEVAAAATPIIDRGAPTIDEKAGTISWPAVDGELSVGFKLFQATGTKTGTFGVGKRKSN